MGDAHARGGKVLLRAWELWLRVQRAVRNMWKMLGFGAAVDDDYCSRLAPRRLELPARISNLSTEF